MVYIRKGYHPWNKGTKQTPEQRAKSGAGVKHAYVIGKKACYFLGHPEKHPRWKGGITHSICKDCGESCSYASNYCKSCIGNHRSSGWHSKNMSGECNHLWKGAKVGYRSLHHWVDRWLGKALECVYCGKDKIEGRIEWASISHHAKRDLSDYISLCVACHRKYDKEARIQL